MNSFFMYGGISSQSSMGGEGLGCLYPTPINIIKIKKFFFFENFFFSRKSYIIINVIVLFSYHNEKKYIIIFNNTLAYVKYFTYLCIAQ